MTDQPLPKVLVVDDQRTFHMIARERLNGMVRSLHARTIEEAQSLYETNPDVRVIVMDACVPGNTPTTHHFVRELRKSFRGPIIGCSNDFSNLYIMSNAGCSHICEKQRVFEVLQSLLAAPSPPLSGTVPR